MSVIKFYNPNGVSIDKEKFIEKYNASYYLKGEKLVKGAIQNSIFVEQKIDLLLKNGIKSERDIAHILAWKVGKIKHSDSDNEQKFVYASDWEGVEKHEVKRYGQVLYLSDFVTYIANNIEELEETANNNPQDVLEKLRNNSPKGIGTVYLFTLLYFISKGKYPIYDRFAHVALDAILEKKQPGDNVPYKDLPTKQESKFSNVYEIYNEIYKKKIDCIFGKQYYENRDIDRALWVYGHLFNYKK